MWRASLKNLLARKLRLMLSAMAILLGVGFVSGSFIFTDALGRVFDGISSGSVGQVVIRPANRAAPQTSSTTQDTRTVPTSVLQQVRKVPGVARVDGNVVSLSTYVVGKDGHVVGGQGAPGVALNVTNAPNATGIPGDKVVDGRMPTKAGEVALDEKTVERSGYYIGEKVTIASSTQARPLTPTLVGTVSFGSGTAGATMTYFDTATAQRLFLRGKDVFSDAWVSAPQLSQEQLRTQVAAALPKGFEAVTGDKAAKETADQFREALSFVTTFLLVFAGISLFVGAFLIVNTFSILVAQRSRELALFRALGASGRQVTLSVVLEALAIALIGSTLGLGLGVLLALAISAAMSLMGLELTQRGLERGATDGVDRLRGRSGGNGDSRLLASPPRRQHPTDRRFTGRRGGHRRTTAPSLGHGYGVDPAWCSSASDRPVPLRPQHHVVGWRRHFWRDPGGGPDLTGAGVSGGAFGGIAYRRVFGAVGQMAENNALRSPRRTAATASALMIGLTLVSMMSVFGESAKASVDQVVSKSFWQISRFPLHRHNRSPPSSPKS